MGRGPSIEARKNATDAKRGKIFTKIIREIGVAARAGGGDPNNNPRLRVAVDKALSANMSKDVIERAIKKATGELEGVVYEEVRYEGYAPGGVAVIVDCLTDNRVRTVADVRHAFSKCGGNMGTEGSVAFMFKRLGVLSYAPGANEDAITEAAIEAGADDVVVYPDDGSIDVLTSPDAFLTVKEAMEAAGLAIIWMAHAAWQALAGAAVVGFGFSLVFPALGMEAVKRVPATNRGSALGAYALFLDFALGLTGPVAGFIAKQGGYPTVYLFAALSAVLALGLSQVLAARYRARLAPVA